MQITGWASIRIKCCHIFIFVLFQKIVFLRFLNVLLLFVMQGHLRCLFFNQCICINQFLFVNITDLNLNMHFLWLKQSFFFYFCLFECRVGSFLKMKQIVFLYVSCIECFLRRKCCRGILRNNGWCIFTLPTWTPPTPVRSSWNWKFLATAGSLPTPTGQPLSAALLRERVRKEGSAKM